MKVLAFGEILFDVIEGEPFLGGAPLNFAVHLARFGVDSYILSKVGKDELGDQAVRQTEKLGVKTAFIQKDAERPTGTVEVELNQGQPDYTILENVAYDFIKPIDKEEVGQLDFDILYYGTLAQRNDESRSTLAKLIAEKKFEHVFYDVNLRKGFYSKEILHGSLRRCTILKLNDEEVIVLGEMFFQQMLSMENFAFRVAEAFGIKIILITAGADGCLVYNDGELSYVKGYPAKVVDTVGAGDSFSAAFLYRFFVNGDPVRAADIANQLGAFVASSRGPIPDYSPEIMRVLKIKK